MPRLFCQGFVRGYFANDFRKAFGKFDSYVNDLHRATEHFSRAYKNYIRHQRHYNLTHGKHTQRARKSR